MTAIELAAYQGAAWGALDRAAQWRLRLADHCVTAAIALRRSECTDYSIAINRITAMLEMGGAERGGAS
jgi:hypothetical protein